MATKRSYPKPGPKTVPVKAHTRERGSEYVNAHVRSKPRPKK